MSAPRTGPRDQPETSFTVVVSGDDDGSLSARDLAQQWHAEHLLRDFAWVTPQDVAPTAGGPPVVLARLMSASADQATDAEERGPVDPSVDLMSLLGSRPRTLIRLVLLQFLTHEAADLERLGEVCAQIAQMIVRAMPDHAQRRPGQPPTRLLRINLLVPESDLQPQKAPLLQPGWEVNAVVSPEDRPDLDRVSLFVRAGTNLYGHGVAAAASAGGMWSEVRLGAFDDDQGDSTTGGSEVQVLRCQTRIVVGDMRGPNLAAGLVETVQSTPDGALPFVSWGVPAENPAGVARSAVDTLLQSPEWAPVESEPRPFQRPAPQLGELMRQWAQFQATLPLTVGLALLRRGTSAEQPPGARPGEAGPDAAGRRRPPTAQQALAGAEARVRDTAAEYSPDRLQEEVSRWGRSTPAAWRELREVALGLVDGGRLPARFTRTTRGGTDEALTPDAVVPHPDETLDLGVLGLGAGLRAVDVHAAALLEAEVREREKTREEREAREALAEAKRRARRLAGPRKAAQKSAPAETDTDEAASPAERADRPTDEDKGRPTGQPTSQPTDQRTELERFQDWVESRQDSLMWQLATKVDAFRAREQRVAAAAQQQLTDAQPPSTRRLQSAQDLLLVCWGIVAVGAALLGVSALIEWRWGFLDYMAALPSSSWAGIGTAATIVVLVLLVAGTLYFQALRAYRRRLEETLHALRQAGDAYVHASRQSRRWDLMYRGVLDWAEVFAELVHRPWADAPVEQPPRGSYEGLPAAVAVAVPIRQMTLEPAVVERGVEAVCQRGWLGQEFHRLVATLPRRARSRSGQSADLPADLDLGQRGHGARSELRVHAASLEAKAAATEHLVVKVSELVSTGGITMPAQQVVRVGPYSRGEPVDDTEHFAASSDVVAPFSPDVFAPRALLQRCHVPERVVLSLPVSAPEPSLPRATVRRAGVSTALRVDVSTVMQPDDVRIFAAAAESDQPTISPWGDFN